MQMVQRRASAFGGKRASGQLAGVRTAQHFQLDQCLSAKAMDKIIFQMQSAAETRQSA